jgi:hypothetical protein
METVELLNGAVEPLECLVALAQQVLKPGFSGFQTGVYSEFLPISPATVEVRFYRPGEG